MLMNKVTIDAPVVEHDVWYPYLRRFQGQSRQTVVLSLVPRQTIIRPHLMQKLYSTQIDAFGLLTQSTLAIDLGLHLTWGMHACRHAYRYILITCGYACKDIHCTWRHTHLYLLILRMHTSQYNHTHYMKVYLLVHTHYVQVFTYQYILTICRSTIYLPVHTDYMQVFLPAHTHYMQVYLPYTYTTCRYTY
jgi:hypothetical protein